MKERKRFCELGLSKEAIEAIGKKGFDEPTEIQAMTIPEMLKDDADIIAQSQTGTGKTAAFVLPLLEMINVDSRLTQALILVPTRELAIQVSEQIDSLKGKKAIKMAPIYGGQSIELQLQKLNKGVHIAVGTPGRIIDHLNRKTLKIDKIEHLILDEADEMLDMGFVEDVEKIIKYTNPKKRMLLCSATMSGKVKELAKKYMNGYKLLGVKKKELTTKLTEQRYFQIRQSEKFEALCRVIDIEDNFYALVFCRRKVDVDSLATHLTDKGYAAGAIHGDISQAQRERTLKKFKSKKINILVATDVAARGIDVSNLTHVINYSLPQDAESYVHRIGRTGRAGNNGTAITFITHSEHRQLMFIQRVTKTNIIRTEVPKIKDIINAKKKRICDNLSALEQEISPVYYDWACKMLEGAEPAKRLAGLLSYCFKKELDPSSYAMISESAPKRKPSARSDRSRLFVALGSSDRVDEKKLVKLIAEKGSVKPNQISNIRIMNDFSFVTIPSEKADKIVAGFRNRGKRPLITRARAR